MAPAYIDYDFWTLQLETLSNNPDVAGIVLWADRQTWDPSWPWWQATKDFIEGL